MSDLHPWRSLPRRTMRHLVSVWLGFLLASAALAAVAVHASSKADCTWPPHEHPPDAVGARLDGVDADVVATTNACADQL